MSKPTTLTLAVTLALATTTALAQSPSEPEFLPNSASTAPFSRSVQSVDRGSASQALIAFAGALQSEGAVVLMRPVP